MTNDIIELEARASSALSMNFCMPSRRMVRITLFSGKSTPISLRYRTGISSFADEVNVSRVLALQLF
jgi:hypothetical protein